MYVGFPEIAPIYWEKNSQCKFHYSPNAIPQSNSNLNLIAK